MNNYLRKIAPQIDQGFAGVGAFSSRQGDAKARALSDMNNSLLGQLGDFQFKNQQQQAAYDFQGQENAQGRMLQSIQLAQQVANSPLASASMMTQALAPFQNFEQGKLDTKFNEFQRTAQENSPWLKYGMDYLGRNQSVTYNPRQSGGIGGALGGMATGGALGGLFGGGAAAAAGTAAATAGSALAGLGGTFGLMGSGIAAAGAGGAAAAGAGLGSFLGPIGMGIGGLLGLTGLLG